MKFAAKSAKIQTIGLKDAVEVRFFSPIAEKECFTDTKGGN